MGDGAVSPCVRSVHKALKQARQFEVRKLSAQLWKLKDCSGSGERKKKRKLAPEGDEEHLRAEIEALKALDLGPLTQLAIARAENPSEACAEAIDPGGLEARLLADVAVVTALRAVTRQLDPCGAESSPSALSVSGSEDEPRDGPGDSEGGGTSSDEDPGETHRKRMQLLSFLPAASRLKEEASCSPAESRPNKGASARGSDRGEDIPSAKKRRVDVREVSGGGEGKRQGPGMRKGAEPVRGKKGEKRPDKKRLGQHARQRLREQYAEGTLPPWMVKTYARYLKPAIAAAETPGSGTQPTLMEGRSRDAPQTQPRRHGSAPSGEGGGSVERGRGPGSGSGGRGAGETNPNPRNLQKPPGITAGPYVGKFPKEPASKGKGKGSAQLHPSWEAKRMQAVKMAAVVPKGKKIVFDEEEGPRGVVPPTTGTTAERGGGVRLKGSDSRGPARGLGSSVKGSGGARVQGLHPSWEAKKVQAEKVASLVSNQGKKILFDD